MRIDAASAAMTVALSAKKRRIDIAGSSIRRPSTRKIRGRKGIRKWGWNRQVADGPMPSTPRVRASLWRELSFLGYGPATCTRYGCRIDPKMFVAIVSLAALAGLGIVALWADIGAGLILRTTCWPSVFGDLLPLPGGVWPRP